MLRRVLVTIAASVLFTGVPLTVFWAAADPREDPPGQGWCHGKGNPHECPTQTPQPSDTPTPAPEPGSDSRTTSDHEPGAAGPESHPAGGSSGSRSSPPGNNGTVKLDDAPFDDQPDNEPHVGCTFQIDFSGFDRGHLQATYTLELWPPTGGGVLRAGSVPIGEDAAGGATDLDASVTVDLADELAASSAQAHPTQGFHVRLTVHAQGSQGADVKHKVFWVRGCVSPVSPTETTTPPAKKPRRPVAFTGFEAGPLALLLLAFLVLGAGLLRLSARRPTD